MPKNLNDNSLLIYGEVNHPCVVFTVHGAVAPGLARIHYTALAWTYGLNSYVVVVVNPDLMQTSVTRNETINQIKRFYRERGYFDISPIGYYEKGIIARPDNYGNAITKNK
jgi:hypothetical protein